MYACTCSYSYSDQYYSRAESRLLRAAAVFDRKGLAFTLRRLSRPGERWAQVYLRPQRAWEHVGRRKAEHGGRAIKTTRNVASNLYSLAPYASFDFSAACRQKGNNRWERGGERDSPGRKAVPQHPLSFWHLPPFAPSVSVFVRVRASVPNTGRGLSTEYSVRAQYWAPSKCDIGSVHLLVAGLPTFSWQETWHGR